jgi:hypothetical protein
MPPPAADEGGLSTKSSTKLSTPAEDTRGEPSEAPPDSETGRPGRAPPAAVVEREAVERVGGEEQAAVEVDPVR